MEEAIQVLTKMYIQEHLNKSDNKYLFSKEELLKFCIKMLKVIAKK